MSVADFVQFARMISILVMSVCTIAALLVLLDFVLKNFTTYKIAKNIQGPKMYPIVGATQLLLTSQSKFILRLLSNAMCICLSYFAFQSH